MTRFIPSDRGQQTVFALELPLPPRDLSPNRTRAGAWRPRVKATSAYRTRCFLLCKEQMRDGRIPRLKAPVAMSLDFYMAGCHDQYYRPKDVGNAIASFKAGIDGIVDSGILPGDDYRQVTIGRVRLYRTTEEHGGRCCVVVTLEPPPC